MQLREYMTILRRRKWVIAIVAAATLLVATINVIGASPIFESTATLYIATTVDGEYNSGQINYADRLKRTYSILATSDSLMDELQAEFDLLEEPDVDVVVLANTELMEVKVRDTDPGTATVVANAIAQAIVDESVATRQGEANPVRVRIAATEPDEASGPNNRLTLALGAFAGLSGGLALAFLIENLDTRLYTTDQVRSATDLVILGEIPKMKKSSISVSGLYDEAFLNIHSRLAAIGSQQPLRSLTITGAVSGEGKSTVAAGLAYVTAQAGRSVVIVDADLRRPSIHRLLGLSNDVGLHDVLANGTPVADVIQEVSHCPGLSVITSGQTASHPFELFTAERMMIMLIELESQFDEILIDTPALAHVPDAALIGPQTDGVLLVVGQGRANLEAVIAAEQQLAIARAEPIGVVINQAARKWPMSSNFDFNYRQR